MEPQLQHDQLFGTLPPTRLFFRCALPSMVSMAVTSLYTIADGIFVGRFIGAEALAAVNLVMPLIMISFALADMVAVGSSVQIAIRLGERDEQAASRIFSFACGMIFAISVAAGAIGFFFADDLVRLLGADGLVKQYAVDYMRVYALFSPAIMIFFAVDNFLRICGRVRYSMVMNIVISLGNIVLDALLIVGFRMGVAAAAFASCLCLTAGTLIGFWPFLRGRLPLRFTRLLLKPRAVLNIIANGSSEFFSNIASSVCMVLFNAVLMAQGGYLAVAAFSVVMYIDSVVKSILFGMSDALQPAISYNYGALNTDRVFALERRVQLAGLLISVAVLAWMLTGAGAILPYFMEAGNTALLDLSRRALHLFALSYLVSWCGIVSGSFFTALNRPLSSLLLSFSQTLLLPGLSLLILPRFWGLDGVWLSSLSAGLVAALLSAILLHRTVRHLRRTG